jgi:hypothetical protein
VRGIGDEVSLSPKRSLEPSEHVVKRVREHANLSTGTRRTGALRQVAGVSCRGDPGDASQRRGDERGEHDPDDDCHRQCSRTDENEGTPEAGLSLLDRSEWVGHT